MTHAGTNNGLPPLADGLWESARAIHATVEWHSISDALFIEHAQRHRLPFRRLGSWATEATAVSLPGTVELVHSNDDDTNILLGVFEAETLVRVELSRGRVEVSIAARTADAAERALARVREALPEAVVAPDEVRVPFAFAWRTERGLAWTSRTLDVSRWSDIARNYATPTRRQLASLARRFRPQRSGQTIIWHGAPGTGKTHALRALAYEWRDWCDLTVVTDPDQLFGPDAGYLMSLALHPPGTKKRERYRLLVLEDSGELLTGDARQLVGHGLSRFLNLCDGLLGQTEKLLLLVTTNEPLKRLHPAVRRPGRCAAEVEFKPLDVRAANRWLANRGVSTRAREPRTLAELYALADGREALTSDGHVPIGFGGAIAHS